MKRSTRLLWWFGSIAITSLAVIISLRDWHWSSLMARAEYAIFGRGLSGFRGPYPYCEIAENGISPNGQIAFIVAYSMEPRVSSPPNCLVFRSRPSVRFDLPTEIQSSSRNRAGYVDGVIRWAKDSSAVVCFKNGIHRDSTEAITDRSAYSIYVIPIINGMPGKPSSLQAEILKIAHPDFVKALEGHMKFSLDWYSHISDLGFEDNFTFNNANQLVVDCFCYSIRSSDMDASVQTGEARVIGLWDPIQGKFVKVSVERVASAN